MKRFFALLFLVGAFIIVPILVLSSFVSKASASSGAIVAEDRSYSDHVVVAPKTIYKLGDFNFQAGDEEARITQVVIDWDTTADAFDASDDLSDLFITVGSHLFPIKRTVTDTANTFVANVSVPAYETVEIAVYADVASTASDSDGVADTGVVSTTVTYSLVGSGVTVTASEVAGQTITFGEGAFLTSLHYTSPLSRSVYGDQEVVGAVFGFEAINETYTITEIKLKVGALPVSSTITSVQLYDGDKPVGPAVAFTEVSGTRARVAGLNVEVLSNTTKTLIAKLNLNKIGPGAGASDVNVALTLDSVEYMDSQGVKAVDGNDREGHALYVYEDSEEDIIFHLPYICGGPGCESVNISVDGPESSTLLAGQPRAELAHFTFRNCGMSDVQIDRLVFKHIGVSANATLPTVSLYEYGNQDSPIAIVADTFSQGTVVFDGGLFSIPAGQMRTVTLAAGIAPGTSGQTVGVLLTEYTRRKDISSTYISLFGELHDIATGDFVYVPSPEFLRYYHESDLLRLPGGNIYLYSGVPVRW